jgi:hypothetical protein
MWDEIQNLKTADLQVREQLNSLEKTWVIGRLVSHSGVNGALWRGQDRGLRLTVEYDADVVNGPELLDLLQTCGLHAKPAPIGVKRSDAAAA